MHLCSVRCRDRVGSLAAAVSQPWTHTAIAWGTEEKACQTEAPGPGCGSQQGHFSKTPRGLHVQPGRSYAVSEARAPGRTELGQRRMACPGGLSSTAGKLGESKSQRESRLLLFGGTWRLVTPIKAMEWNGKHHGEAGAGGKENGR